MVTRIEKNSDGSGEKPVCINPFKLQRQTNRACLEHHRHARVCYYRSKVGSVFSHSVFVPLGDNSYYFCLFFSSPLFRFPPSHFHILVIFKGLSIENPRHPSHSAPSPLAYRGHVTLHHLHLGVCILMTLLSVFMLMLLQSIFFQMVSSYHIYCTFFLFHFDFLFLYQFAPECFFYWNFSLNVQF